MAKKPSKTKRRAGGRGAPGKLKVDLDSEKFARRLDREGIYGKIEAFPQTIREALRLGEGVTLPMRYFRKYERIAFLAMGGSGAGGDFLRDAAPYLDIHSVHDYSIPPYFGPETLCIAITYSGKTEETIAAAAEAHRRNCNLLGIGGGFALKEACSRTASTHVEIPLLYQPTRIGMSFVTFTPAGLLKKLGILQLSGEDMDEIVGTARKVLEDCALSVPEKRNPAKRMARQLSGLPITIYSHASIGSVAARIKNDIAENAKAPVKAEPLPECNHNEFSTWQGKPRAAAILLRSSQDESEEVRLGLDLSAKVLKRNAKVFLEISLPQTRSKLARLVATSYFGMFLSYYLALRLRTNVAKTPLQEAVKKKLPKSFTEGILAGIQAKGGAPAEAGQAPAAPASP